MIVAGLSARTARAESREGEERCALERRVEAPVRLMDQVERERRDQDDDDQGQLEQAVEPEGRPHSVGDPSADRSTDGQTPEEPGQDRRDSLRRIPEDKHQLARPDDLVDQPGGTRQDEYAEDHGGSAHRGSLSCRSAPCGFAYHPSGMLARLGRVLGDHGPMGRSLGVILLAAAWVATWRPQVDPDAWWHIAIGKTILASGAIPRVEPFSWLTEDAPFVAHSWSWDVLLAAASEAGMTGTSLLVLPITAAIVGVSWILIGIVAPGIAPVPRAFLILTAVAASLPQWAPRSQTLDVLFVLCAACILAIYLRRGSRRWLFALSLIGVLWANLHGSAILGLVAILIVAIVAIPVGRRWGTWPQRPFWPLVAAGLAAVAAACLNPYGPALLAYPFDRDVASAFSVDIVEWRSPDFGARELVFARVALASVLLLAAAWPRRGRDPFLLLAAAAWTFAALGAVRFLPIAAFLIVAAAAHALVPAVSRWLGGRGLPAEGEQRSPMKRGPFAIAAGIASLAVVAVGSTFITPQAQSAAIDHRLPVAAIEALEARPCPGRILPAYGWAGYVIEVTGREVGAYGNSAERPLREQAAIEAVTVDPRPWLDANLVEIALMPATGPLSHWLDEADGWRLVYRDTQATIHVLAGRVDCQP